MSETTQAPAAPDLGGPYGMSGDGTTPGTVKLGKLAAWATGAAQAAVDYGVSVLAHAVAIVAAEAQARANAVSAEAQARANADAAEVTARNQAISAAMAGVASATTTSDLQTQITALKARIDAAAIP